MPSLVQFADLTPGHFESHALWASCHSLDSGEPWYEQTDEETFRPWTGALPIHAAAGMFLVRARLTLADGSLLPGFATPVAPDASGHNALALLQPQLFLPSGQVVSFWLGMFGDSAVASAALYKALGKPATSVFPIQVMVEPELWLSDGPIEINGFYTVPDGKTVRVSR
jgi:hypothetical protein